ncbi:MAG: RNA-binding protein [Mucilaginibacter sp.]|nr:RNA-binding protein [Mucilaginibacter sp.]
MKKLFVSGFPLGITEMELALLIAPYGDIETIKIVRDKKTKKCKGYAFIEMKDSEGAENAATSLNGQDMQGRELTVNINPELAGQSPSVHQTTIERAAVQQEETIRISPRITRTENEKPKRPRRARI